MTEPKHSFRQERDRKHIIKWKSTETDGPALSWINNTQRTG